MNTKLWLCIGVAVLVAHLALLFIIDHWRKLGQPAPPPPPDPTFSTTTYRYVDDHGREVKVERQFKVSTTFADQETLSKLPPPPAAQ